MYEIFEAFLNRAPQKMIPVNIKNCSQSIRTTDHSRKIHENYLVSDMKFEDWNMLCSAFKSEQFFGRLNLDNSFIGWKNENRNTCASVCLKKCKY